MEVDSPSPKNKHGSRLSNSRHALPEKQTSETKKKLAKEGKYLKWQLLLKDFWTIHLKFLINQ